jgi:hypothetical protein
MKVHELNGRKIVAVKVPEDAHSFRIDNSGYLLMVVPINDHNLSEFYLDDWKPLVGNWEILGRVNEITEQVWEGVVEKGMPFGRVKRYKDYEFVDSCFYTATESALSFCKANSIDLQDLILIDKQ